MKFGVRTIFELEKFAFPVFRKGNHQTLVVIDFRSEKILYYDSMGSEFKHLELVVRRFLEDEYRNKHQEEKSFDNYHVHYPKNIPQQENNSDCGVFALKFLEWAIEDIPFLGPFRFEPKHIPIFRRRIILEIIKGRLLD